MNQKHIILFLILSGFFSACQNTGKSEQNGMTRAYYEGTYRFSEFESMTVGTWIVGDSACLLLKKKDADSEYNASSGFIRKLGELYVMDAGNEGRLVFKYKDHQIEVLNNEGEPISRDSKFLLSITGDYPDSKHLFSAKVWFPESEPGFISFCQSGIRMKIQKSESDPILEVSDKAFQVQLSVLQDDSIQSPKLQVKRIVQELNPEICK
jgi:hypothetical protein